MTDRALMQQALEALESCTPGDTTTGHVIWPSYDEMIAQARKSNVEAAITALQERLAQPEQEPVAWMPIEQMYPQAKAIDILMGDGSILCAVLPQFDGDLWWEGSGTGEKFIDPKYANVTHWRIHDERTSPSASKPWVGLTADEIWKCNKAKSGSAVEFHICVEHQNVLDFAESIEAKLREKNA